MLMGSARLLVASIVISVVVVVVATIMCVTVKVKLVMLLMIALGVHYLVLMVFASLIPMSLHALMVGSSQVDFAFHLQRMVNVDLVW